MLSKDPVKRGLNPYPYCDNDPANYTDPTGEVANILAGGIVGGTIGFAWGFAGSAISQRMSGRRVDWRRAAGAGINGAVIGAVRGAMTASGVGAAAAFAGNFAAGTAGSALEQWIGTGNVSARRSVAGGLINAVNNAVYKDYVFKSGTQALKKGLLAGGARAGIEYLSETLGKPSKYDRNRRSTRRSYMPESRDLRISCGRPDPLGKSLGYSSARGYQYKNPQTNRGFRLGEFIGTVMRGGLMEGLNNLMFFEAGKAVEALGVSVSPHEGERRTTDPYDLQPTHSQVLSKNKMKALSDDISLNGIQEPIKYVEYNGKMYVVNGQHRLLVAKRLGLTEVPIERVELPYAGYSTIKDLLWFE